MPRNFMSMLPREILRSLPILVDRQPLSLVPGAGDGLESFCLSSGTLPGIPWLCGRDTPNALDESQPPPRAKCDAEGRLLLPQPVKHFHYSISARAAILPFDPPLHDNRASGNCLS